MVTSVTSFGRSGLSDWLVQRISGVVLLTYLIVIVNGFPNIQHTVLYTELASCRFQKFMEVFRI